MPDKEKINYSGREVLATPIDVNQAGEQWNTYLLDDGTALRTKLVITKVYRIDDQHDAEGNPVYVFMSTNIATVNAPTNLRKK